MIAFRLSVVRQGPALFSLRSYQSRAEFRQWIDRVQITSMPRPRKAVLMSPAQATPFLVSLDPMAESNYRVWQVPKGQAASEHSPVASFIEVRILLSNNEVVRTAVSDLGSWSSFRLSKFYELVDVLTGDVAYRFSAGLPVDWVTGGHYHSRKIRKTNLTKDIHLRCYLTRVGTSSVEIRTDAVQDNELVNACHTVMVALDPHTMRPLNNVNVTLPALEYEDGEDEEGQRHRAELAEWHECIRKARVKSTMQLRTSISTPPTPSEVQDIHHLHQNAIRMREGRSPRPIRPRNVGEYTFRSSFVIFPEDRNVHGKLFGGYVMSQAYNLALYAVKFFVRSGQSDAHGVVPLGIDEAVFHQPVSIGDLISFTARVVHATEYTCRVFVTVQVLDPTDPDRLPTRSNRLIFVFAARPCMEWKDCHYVVPQTYSEVLMQVEATRRYAVEGPSDAEAWTILEEAAKTIAAPL